MNSNGLAQASGIFGKIFQPLSKDLIWVTEATSLLDAKA